MSRFKVTGRQETQQTVGVANGQTEERITALLYLTPVDDSNQATGGQIGLTVASLSEVSHLPTGSIVTLEQEATS